MLSILGQILPIINPYLYETKYLKFHDWITNLIQYAPWSIQNIDGAKFRMAVYILIFNVHFAPYSEIEYAPLHLNSACYYKKCIVCTL